MGLKYDKAPVGSIPPELWARAQSEAYQREIGDQLVPQPPGSPWLWDVSFGEETLGPGFDFLSRKFKQNDAPFGWVFQWQNEPETVNENGLVAFLLGRLPGRSNLTSITPAFNMDRGGAVWWPFPSAEIFVFQFNPGGTGTSRVRLQARAPKTLALGQMYRREVYQWSVPRIIAPGATTRFLPYPPAGSIPGLEDPNYGVMDYSIKVAPLVPLGAAAPTFIVTQGNASIPLEGQFSFSTSSAAPGALVVGTSWRQITFGQDPFVDLTLGIGSPTAFNCSVGFRIDLMGGL